MADGRDWVTTEALVLRKTPYSETSLIVAVLTREHGQLHLMLKGARATSKRAFPEVDLFRRVQVIYLPSHQTDLYRAKSAQCLIAYDSVAQHPEQYRAACWLLRLALDNSVAHEPAPLLYEALCVALGRLAAPGAAILPIVLGVCFITLDELGLQPSAPPESSTARHLDRMRAFTLTPSEPVPDYPAASWHDLRRWMHRHLHHVGLRVPPGWELL